MNYLFVDEVQMCPKFELAINSLYSCLLYTSKKSPTIITGLIQIFQDGIMQEPSIL